MPNLEFPSLYVVTVLNYKSRDYFNPSIPSSPKDTKFHVTQLKQCTHSENRWMLHNEELLPENVSERVKIHNNNIKKTN